MSTRLAKSQRQLHQDADSPDLIGDRRKKNLANGTPYVISYDGQHETMSEVDNQGVARRTRVYDDGYINLNASNLSALPIKARNERIKALRADDIPVKVIAQEADLTQQRVYQILRT